MVEIFLTQAIREFVENAVKDFRFPVKNGEARAPEIVNGYLPPKRTGKNDDFPFVVVYPASGEIERDATGTEIELIIGNYSAEYDGYEFCMNMLSRIRNALAMLPDNILAGKYQLLYPISWENIEEQPYPQWQMRIKTQWKTVSPQPEYTGGR